MNNATQTSPETQHFTWTSDNINTAHISLNNNWDQLTYLTTTIINDIPYDAIFFGKFDGKIISTISQEMRSNIQKIYNCCSEVLSMLNPTSKEYANIFKIKIAASQQLQILNSITADIPLLEGKTILATINKISAFATIIGMIWGLTYSNNHAEKIVLPGILTFGTCSIINVVTTVSARNRMLNYHQVCSNILKQRENKTV